MDAILEVSQRLQDLNRRLAEVESERASLKDQIAVCTSQLGELTNIHVRPAQGAALRDHIMWIFRRGIGLRILSPIDIAYELNMLRTSDQSNIRGCLKRLVKEGHLRKTAHGRYQNVR
jgi:hypothetical protein